MVIGASLGQTPDFNEPNSTFHPLTPVKYPSTMEQRPFHGFVAMILNVYNQIDAANTINFSTQFGAANIRERCLFRSVMVWKLSEKV